jgi:hypothetical protein
MAVLLAGCGLAALAGGLAVWLAYRFFNRGHRPSWH